jgi:hypothetical protein
MQTILKDEIFQLNMGWLSSQQAKIFDCVMLTKDKKAFEYRFNRIQFVGFKLINIWAG